MPRKIPAAPVVHPHGRSAFPGRLTLESLVGVLRGHGLRMTANRQALLRAMLDADVPQSLEQLQATAMKFSPRNEAPDFATVFRMMTLLEELRLARKVHLGRSTSHYELTDSEHHRDHLVCTDLRTGDAAGGKLSGGEAGAAHRARARLHAGDALPGVLRQVRRLQRGAGLPEDLERVQMEQPLVCRASAPLAK